MLKGKGPEQLHQLFLFLLVEPIAACEVRDAPNATACSAFDRLAINIRTHETGPLITLSKKRRNSPKVPAAETKVGKTDLAVQRRPWHVLVMTLETVRRFLADHAGDLSIIETRESSATVALAAAAHGVEPQQIAKTIALRVGEDVLLVVASGTSRLDNRKCRDAFGGKPRMLDGEEVVALTGHPVGGVCPFGLATPLPIYCDVSLRSFQEVLPAAGATNAAIRIAPERMADLVGAQWVDVCQ